mgnify:CR=1 FL=1
MTGPDTYTSIHRNTALLLVGMLGLIAALVAGIATARQFAPDGNAMLRLMFTVLGGFVAGFIVLALACLRRHRWTLHPGQLVIEERPWLRFTGPSRRAQVAFNDIAGLASVQNGADDVIELATRQGASYRMGPASLKPKGHSVADAIRAIDRAGLAAFAASLQAAMQAEGVAPPRLLPGLGFWNRPLGLGLLGVLLALSLGLAVLVVVAVLGGAGGPRNAMDAAAILVLLPVGVAWMLRKAWRRRQTALRAKD